MAAAAPLLALYEQIRKKVHSSIDVANVKAHCPLIMMITVKLKEPYNIIIAHVIVPCVIVFILFFSCYYNM